MRIIIFKIVNKNFLTIKIKIFFITQLKNVQTKNKFAKKIIEKLKTYLFTIFF